MQTSLVAGLVAVALSAAGPLFAQQQTLVSFAEGQSSATMTGSISGDQDRSYLVDATAGQTLTVQLKATRGSAEMNVWAPGDDTALTVGATDPYRFTTVLPRTGRYRVQVYQMRASARRGETAAYTLTVALAGEGKAGADARVAGTRYHATADVPCVTSVGGPAGPCKAGVIRHGQGDATVELQTPDGGARKLRFTRGQATGSDGTGAFGATREGDVQVIRIGTVEVYRIPDAFVLGG